jgi:hypothetical protein
MRSRVLRSDEASKFSKTKKFFGRICITLIALLSVVEKRVSDGVLATVLSHYCSINELPG